MSEGNSRIDQISGALQQLRETLECDGYDLTMQPSKTGVTLQVAARQGACEECLVPKQLFLGLVTQALDDAGVPYQDLSLELVYPLDKHG